MYVLKHVSKQFDLRAQKVAALDDVSATIADGEFLAVQGPTGQGKTTLLQLLGGLDRPSRGSVELNGRDLARLSEGELTEIRAREIGFIFQTFNLIPTLTAQENVECALVPFDLPGADRRARAEQALEEVGLADRSRHVPSQLSGGQQQRVAIARAIVKEPKVLLADEPTGNLDEETRDDIVELLEGMWRQRGLTLVIVTHDSTVAQRAQRQVLMKKGKLSIRKARVGAA